MDTTELQEKGYSNRFGIGFDLGMGRQIRDSCRQRGFPAEMVETDKKIGRKRIWEVWTREK